MTVGIQVRPEQSGDAAAVRRVNEAAFGEPDEAGLVEALHAAGATTLSLVAEADGLVIGHILFSPVTITGPSDSNVVGLGPVSVLPEWQRKGVGSRLIREGLDRLRDSGAQAIVVLGHPEYYPRFGFVRASLYGIRWELDCPDEAFMALELQPGALTGRPGIVRYRPEFTSVSPEEH